MPDDTIVAIATPPGRGGIGTVRLSGPSSLSIARLLLRLRNSPAPRRAGYGAVLDADGTPIDDALLTWFPSPNSYTGEEVVEISTHGSPVVLETVIGLALQHGARLARPGEFTERAFLQGRLDLTQAEAVRDLIEAETLGQARLAAEQLHGSLSRQVRPAKGKLIELIAALEAGIDFAEDDLETLPANLIGDRIADLLPGLEELLRSFSHGRLLREGLRLAIVGRPNAGKSSLFNRLLDRDRAIVTPIAGTTRDVVSERTSIEGVPIELLDTAGIRHTDDEVERIGVQRSHEAVAEADVVLLVLDTAAGEGILDTAAGEGILDTAAGEGILDTAAGESISALNAAISTHAPHTEEDQSGNTEIRFLLQSLRNRPVVLVGNKIDLESSATSGVSSPTASSPQTTREIAPKAARGLGSDRVSRTPGESISREPIPIANAGPAANTEFPFVRTSARTGEGIPELRDVILSLARGRNALPQAGTATLTNLRQRDAVARAIASLTRAQTAAARLTPHEMLLLDLYESLHALDELTGDTTPDDILNLIFSTFCIGK